jgi:hypothetical protein
MLSRLRRSLHFRSVLFPASGGMVDACGEATEDTTLFKVHAAGKGLTKVCLESASDAHHGKFLRLKDGVLDCLGTHGDPWTVYRVRFSANPLFL